MTPSLVQLAVPCPTCGQAAHDPCVDVVTAATRWERPHRSRLVRAERVTVDTLRTQARAFRAQARREQDTTARAHLRTQARRCDYAAQQLTPTLEASP